MFGPPGNMGESPDPDHYSSWSMVIYHLASDLAPADLTLLRRAMKHRYGEQARTHIGYSRGERGERVLTFYCGEVTSRTGLQDYRDFAANAVTARGLTSRRVYP